MVGIHVYVEGGGDRNHLKTELRQAFTKFAKNAGLKGRMPRFIAGGSRENT
ncbi:hypothetical protein APED_11535 [Acanthopleuribacter pedis]